MFWLVIFSYIVIISFLSLISFSFWFFSASLHFYHFLTWCFPSFFFSFDSFSFCPVSPPPSLSVLLLHTLLFPVLSVPLLCSHVLSLSWPTASHSPPFWATLVLFLFVFLCLYSSFFVTLATQPPPPFAIHLSFCSSPRPSSFLSSFHYLIPWQSC